jgi:hypothetical protein
VPVGTVIADVNTGEIVADLDARRQEGPARQGRAGGLGNIHFKSSVNRAPRQCTKGEPGEERDLRLELRVLADVGLLGLPNAGKSTLIRAVSAAAPEGRRLSVHHAAPEPRRRARRRRQELRHRRRSRPDRRRGRRRRARHPLPQAPGSARASCCTSSTWRRPIRKPTRSATPRPSSAN